jgi:hypothetical protein
MEVAQQVRLRRRETDKTSSQLVSNFILLGIWYLDLI